MRLFEDSTMSPTTIITDLKDNFKMVYSSDSDSDWTTDSEAEDDESDWTTDSEAEVEPENEFRWSATP